MQIQELLRLADWYKDTVEVNGVINAYQALSNVVMNNTRSSSKVSFEGERDTLTTIIKGIDFSGLTLEQINLLSDMGVSQLVGEDGVNHLISTMEKNVIDIASVANHVSDDYNVLIQARDYFESVSSQLKKYYTSEKDEEISDDEVLVRIYFKDGASINDLNDFKESGNNWYNIGRGLALATDHAPEEIRIVGAEKGSVIIDIVAVSIIASALCKIVADVLENTQRILNIKKTLLEIDNLKLQNKKIAQDLEKEIEKETEKGADTILKNACRDLKISKDEGEKRNALKKSIELLMQFTQCGGKLDFIHNEIEDDDEEDHDDAEKFLRGQMELLDENIERIRLLENDIKLLKEGKE